MTENEVKIDSGFWRDDLDDREVMVSIRCTAYNHEPYIRDALEGFVNQKTNFRFEAIVHDDASTDGTAAIIREYAEKYPSIIKPIYETENQYSKRDGSLRRIMNAHLRGKYVAYCEGDDYWTDPNKLQKQVEFMESHKEYSMIHGDVMYKDGISGNLMGCKGDKCRFSNLYHEKFDKDLFIPIILGEYQIQTLSVLIRKKVLDVIPRNYRTFMMGDTPLFLDLSQLGKIKYMNEVIGVYVLHPQSLTHNRNINLKFQFSMYDMRVYYCEKYNYTIPNYIKKKYNQMVVDNLVFNTGLTPKHNIFLRNAVQKWHINNILSGGLYFTIYAFVRKHTRRYIEYIKGRLYKFKLSRLNNGYKMKLSNL